MPDEERRISRREFIKLAGLGAAGAALAACSPTPSEVGTPTVATTGILPSRTPIPLPDTPTPSNPTPTEGQKEIDETFAVKELQEIGERLNEWTVLGKYRMVKEFREIGQTAQLLMGQVDPRKYVELSDPQVRFGYEDDSAGAMGTKYETSDTKMLSINYDQNTTILAPVVERIIFTLKLEPGIVDSDFANPVIMKESMMFIDFDKYVDLMMGSLPNLGITIEPTEKPVPEDQYRHTIIAAVNDFDYAKGYTFSQLDQLMEYGSHIRAGAAETNWWESYLRGEVTDSGAGFKDLNFIKFVHDFLLNKKLQIINDSGLVIWSKGGPPQVLTEEFINLVSEIKSAHKGIYLTQNNYRVNKPTTVNKQVYKWNPKGTVTRFQLI